MGNIIIRDESTGYSKSFVPTMDGYRQADAYRRSIEQQGHVVGGELGRVESVIPRW